MKRIVDTNFWTDSPVIDHYSVEDKFFMLYLSTNPKTTQVGIYSLPLKIISFETGFTIEVVQVLMERFTQTYQTVSYHYDTQEISVLNSLKYSIVKGGRPVSDLLKRELNKVNYGELILQTYWHLKDFWLFSHRAFDRTVMRIFETELINRQLLEPAQSVLIKEVSAKNLDQLELQSMQYYIENYGELNDHMLETYTNWIDRLSENVVLEAIKRAKGSQNPFAFSIELLEKWYSNNAVTLDDVRRLESIFNKLAK